MHIPSDLFWLLEAAICIAFAFVLAKRPGGEWEIPRLRQHGASHLTTDRLKREVDDVREAQQATELAKVESMLRVLLATQPTAVDAFDYFKRKLLVAIDYSVKRHDWYEEQRSRLFQTSLTLMTGVLTVVSLVVRSDSFPAGQALVALWILGTITIIAALRTVLLYNAELDRDQSSLLISDTRFWYYRSSHSAPAVLEPGSDLDEGRAARVATERTRFVDRLLENVPLPESIREDLELLFLLHTLQRGKRDSLSAMRWTLSYFVVFAVPEVIILGLVHG